MYILTRSDVYALESDLYNLKPLRGDLHCHTVFSGGFETPDMVVKATKKHGFDFIAITDHISLGAKQLLPEDKYNIMPNSSNLKSSVEYIRGLLADFI